MTASVRGEKLIDALAEAGVIADATKVRSVIIDATAGQPLTLYVTMVGDSRVVEVVAHEPGFTVQTSAPEEPGPPPRPDSQAEAYAWARERALGEGPHPSGEGLELVLVVTHGNVQWEVRDDGRFLYGRRPAWWAGSTIDARHWARLQTGTWFQEVKFELCEEPAAEAPPLPPPSVPHEYQERGLGGGGAVRVGPPPPAASDGEARAVRIPAWAGWQAFAPDGTGIATAVFSEMTDQEAQKWARETWEMLVEATAAASRQEEPAVPPEGL